MRAVRAPSLDATRQVATEPRVSADEDMVCIPGRYDLAVVHYNDEEAVPVEVHLRE